MVPTATVAALPSQSTALTKIVYVPGGNPTGKLKVVANNFSLFEPFWYVRRGAIKTSAPAAFFRVTKEPVLSAVVALSSETATSSVIRTVTKTVPDPVIELGLAETNCALGNALSNKIGAGKARIPELPYPSRKLKFMPHFQPGVCVQTTGEVEL